MFLINFIKAIPGFIIMLLKRETRVIALMVLGFMLLANSGPVGAFLGTPELAPILFKVGIIAFAMSFARVLLRIFFPWLDLSDLVQKANKTSVGSGAVAVAFIYLIVEMFRLLAVV